MPPEFHKDDHHLPRLRVAEIARPRLRHLPPTTRPISKPISGRKSSHGVRRVLNRPAHILGRSTQILPNNWKLYVENTKDTYHASILHSS